jgi:hypothetical protein
VCRRALTPVRVEVRVEVRVNVVLRFVTLRPVVLRALAKCRIRRLVRWLSFTFADFGLLVFRVCGLTCAAHIPGAQKNPAATTIRRR